ncbi:organic hydroperoxide resistance protein [Tsukamurella pulmonis]|uniref:organic hydroperoxide resistance protein n=1 Tax=Tsukamurella pulmonis TaxID=47312 RepID=UPI000792BC55|nr:organic hydroperoxide resistance protein [Tsukamurella pulmonis]KXP13549.1 organic hydroperoxide resistance protein [Tsukamurella pulmonis]RDH12833.1 organic hydroperoxide resistance protein [Tsukamurella pulmonis]
MSPAYTAEAIATGAGREGRTRTDDGRVDLQLAIPTELGGSGDGSNPEQLFAAGYAACFHSALQLVARQQKVALGDSSVGAKVGISPNDAGGFVLNVDLEVVIPEVEHDAAQALADAAHRVCPYSNAVRGNIDVTVTVTDD